MKQNKLSALIECLACLFLLSSCTDDFAPYKNTDYEISKYITGDIFVISDIEKSITAIANEYVNDAELSYVEYTLYDEKDGDALFQYKKSYKKNDDGYTTLLNIYIDISTKTAYKVEYTDGISKRVSGFIGSYIGQSNHNALDIYHDLLGSYDDEFNELKCIKVIYSNDSVIGNCFDSENSLIYSISYE